MMKQRKIELLAPAKNLECGIEAVNHGADAVYIGAPKFRRTCGCGQFFGRYSRFGGVCPFVQRTHLRYGQYHSERRGACRNGKDDLGTVPHRCRRLIVQDMGITRLNLPPIPLHGSTQMDNRTPEKYVSWRMQAFVR